MIKAEDKISMWDEIKNINYASILLCIFSFVMGRVCVFNTFYCVGIAYVGTIFFSKEIRRWSLVLAVLGLLSKGIFDINVIKYMLILILIGGFREAMSFMKCPYTLKNQMVITGISLLLLDGVAVAIKDITIYKLILCILETAVTLGLMSIIYRAVQPIYNQKTVALNEYELVSVAFLIACLLCGVVDFYVTVPFLGRVYFRDIMIFMVLIASIYLGGMKAGTVISIIVSSVLVVIGYIPASFVPLYVFAAMIGSLFAHLERIGIVFATFLGLLLGFALFNNRVVELSILGAYLIAAPLSLLIPKNYFGLARWVNCYKDEKEDYHIQDIQDMMTKRLKNFSTAFSSLSRQFESISSEHYNLGIKEMNELIEEAGESMCKDCTMREFCWKDYLQNTYKSCYKMLRILEKQGMIKEGDIPEEFKKGCINAESFAYTLGVMLDIFKNDCKWHENFNEARKMLAQQFKGVSDSINTLAVQLHEGISFDTVSEEKIEKSLHSLGVYPINILVLKFKDKLYEIHIYCKYKGEDYFKETVLQGVEQGLEREVEIKRCECLLQEKYSYFEFTLKKKFKVAGSAQFAAKEDISGDVYSYLELEDGQYLLALADGMGSGIDAKKESEMTIELLEKFLEAGFKSDVVLKLINSALVLKSDVECSSTIDMILIDEYTGIAEFFKAGAATSFILREGEITTIKADSMPVGILSYVDVVTYKKQLKDGDIIIMVSDGILEDRNLISDRETTFKHFIIEANSNSPEYLAKFLLEKTKTLLAGRQNDDMTIIAARIWQTN